MPSSLIIPVTTISSVKPHPSADRLDIVQVLGWQCVVQRDRYQVGEKVVYFSPDIVLEKELSDAWEITQYLDKGRIKSTRLRGEPSFGLVMPCLQPEWEVGDNVAEHFPGASKYEPPVRPAYCGKYIDNAYGLPRDPLFPEYTHIQNLRHFPDLLDEEELVVITEKLHGTNSRIGMVNGEWMAGSHRVRRGESDALYWSSKPIVKDLVEALAKQHKQVIVYGEILGSDVQSLDYGYEGHAGYAIFDIMVDGRYLDFFSFQGLCDTFDVPMVPCYGAHLFTLESISDFAKGPTLMAGMKHIREGVVVKPLIERTHPQVGRLILKYVSNDFLLMKNKSDYSEV